jgi:hypothetical protein
MLADRRGRAPVGDVELAMVRRDGFLLVLTLYNQVSVDVTLAPQSLLDIPTT